MMPSTIKDVIYGCPNTGTFPFYTAIFSLEGQLEQAHVTRHVLHVQSI
jgi:hypothetical protein